MDQASNFFCQGFLQFPEVRSFPMFSDQSIDPSGRQDGEDFDITCGIFIGGIQPELIKFIRGSTFRIQPNISRFGFPEFFSIALGHQRPGQAIGVEPFFTTDQFASGSNISPLVGTSHLQHTTVVFTQMKEIVSLHQLIGEFCKRHTLGRLATKAFFYGIFSHHIVDGNMLTDFTDEIQK